MLVNRRFAVCNPLIPVDFSDDRELATVGQVRQVAAALAPWRISSPATRVRDSEAGWAWTAAALEVVDAEQLLGLRRSLRTSSAAQAPAVVWSRVEGESPHSALLGIGDALEVGRPALDAAAEGGRDALLAQARAKLGGSLGLRTRRTAPAVKDQVFWAVPGVWGCPPGIARRRR